MLFSPYEESNPTIQETSGFSSGSEMHSRHPMFRMPNWMSEDDDVSNLASRMSHGQNWAFGNRAPWGEMQNPGNPGENESFSRSDAIAHTIPIRIEAEAPPGCMTEQNKVQEETSPKITEVNPTPKEDSIIPGHSISNQPAYASKTTPTVDCCVQGEIPRDTRSSSAPPDIKEQSEESPRFISKMNITPQRPENHIKQPSTFNNMAKPYHTDNSKQVTTDPVESVSINVVDSVKNVPTPQNNSNTGDHNNINKDKEYPQQSNAPTQKTSVVRNIPILFEGDHDIPNGSSSKPVPTRHHNQTRDPNWNQQFENMPNRFHEDMFQDPFFDLNRFSSPHTQRGGQTIPTEFSQRDYPHAEPPSPKQHPQVFQQSGVSQPSAPVPPQNEFMDFKQSNQVKPPREENVEIKINNQPISTEQPKDIQLDMINKVRNSLTEYQKKVDTFECTHKDKEYRYLDEMLTRFLLELDNIEINGKDDIRQARRTLVKDINSTITALEKKLVPAVETVESMDINEIKESSLEQNEVGHDAKKTKMEVENKENTTVNLTNEDEPISNELPIVEVKMDNTEDMNKEDVQMKT